MPRLYATQTAADLRIKHLETTRASGDSIPASEYWLWRNQDAVNSVQRGLIQAKRGETVSLGSFAEFADSEVDD